MATSTILPGYEAQPDDDGVAHSKRKLEEAAEDLKPWVDGNSITVLPCQSEQDTYAYRCVCTFQVLTCDQKDTDDSDRFCYAMRHEKKPVMLSHFPIATTRIQTAMEELLKCLNQSSGNDSVLTNHLTSSSFASSWGDSSTCDLFVTLYYGKPVDEDSWKIAGQEVCNKLKLTRLIGRSKGRVFIVTGASGCHDYLKDSVYIYRSSGRDKLSLSKRDVPDSTRSIEVHYHKPETAFFHPNSRAMLEALHWMMGRLQETRTEGKLCHMLEMYCGCGAHTVALAKMGYTQSIVAVELDKRLVQACITNCKLNGCYESSNDEGTSPVHVFQGDASEWAKKSLKKKSGWYDKDYSILLVDPPRMGLDDTVCQMAIQGKFQHLLYISCGRHALKRDLERLNGAFEVTDCRLIDLFPRTDAVESLVHLKRRSTA